MLPLTKFKFKLKYQTLFLHLEKYTYLIYPQAYLPVMHI